jgi:general stress protein YciG
LGQAEKTGISLRKGGKGMNPTESGRKGGLATKDNHPTVCPCCGKLIKSQFFAENGQKGGLSTFKRYGREHYVEMGKRGGRGNTKERKVNL